MATIIARVHSIGFGLGGHLYLEFNKDHQPCLLSLPNKATLSIQ